MKYTLCSTCCLFLLILIPSSRSGRISNLNCTAVLQNPPNFPISAINECSRTRRASFSDISSQTTSNCEEVECEEDCVLGEVINIYGCRTCECRQSGMFEGDIILGDRLNGYIRGNYLNPGGRVDTSVQRGAAGSVPLWKMFPSGDNYVVPYILSSSIGSSGRAAIRAAARDFARYTCIRLQPRSSQNRYINFFDGGGCYSPVGAVNRIQDVSLGSGCWYKGTVIHEVLHSLGFWHEQSRTDRDSYIRIISRNIQRGMAYNFNKLTTHEALSLGSSYDTGSVMHYSSYAFSSNGRPTITDLRGNAIKTQRNGFSKVDIKELNKLYGCKVTEETTGTGGGTGTSCTDSNSSCSYWAGIGECQRNAAYMLKSCCKSCKGSTTVTTTASPPTTESSCRDKNVFCSSWASSGECQRNPTYMLQSCCSSCRRPNCKDDHSSCSAWSSNGYCSSSRYITYMSKYCKLSCNKC